MENRGRGNEARALSDSSSDDDTEDEQDAPNSREKRQISWCGVDTDRDYGTHGRRMVVWPPPSNSSAARPARIDVSGIQSGSSMFGSKMQLYSQTGHHLAVYPDRKIIGTPDEDDLYTYLELSSAGYVGHVRIRGQLSNLYVAMDKKGRLYGEANPAEESTVFIESLLGSYNVYLSRKYAHLGWYLGIKKSGKFKKGPKTAYGQKAVKFLPRRAKFQ